MEVRYFQAEDTGLWERFVRDARNGTIMQQRKFLTYHPRERFQDCSLLVFNKKNHLLAVVPAAIKAEQKGNKILCSHPGSSHGGLIVGHNTKTACMLEIVRNIKEFCRHRGFQAIELKMVPRIYHRWPCDDVDFALRYMGAKIYKTELATVLPLQSYHHKKANSTTMRNVRKALKNNLKFKESADLKSYWSILCNNLKVRHNTSPTHSYDEMVDLMKRFKNKIKLFAVYLGERLIAGSVVFILNERAVNCFYIAHDEGYQQYRPLNLLFYQLIHWGKQENFQYLDWGISTEQGGSKINEGLFNFKEGFGGRGMLRETYRIDLK